LFPCRDRSSCAGGERFADARAGCEVFGEEGFELVERDQVGLVVEVDVAGVGISVSDAVREAIAEHIERKRKDKAFRARLQTVMKRDREILERLAR
jgi:ribosomal protein S15P/S13E